MPTNTIIPETQTQRKPSPASLMGALAEAKFQAAQDAARYAGFDNAEGLDPLDDQTAWSAGRGYYRVSEMVAVTIGGEPGEMTMTSYAPSPLVKAVIAALRELQPGTSEPGICATHAMGTIRINRTPDLYYTLSQINTRLHVRGIITTADDCRRTLNHLTGRGVVESIVVREGYGQTHPRLAYRLSPRVSCADLNTLIGDTHAC